MIALASSAATDLDDPEYAKKLYSKAADRMDKGDELMALAKSIVESLKDKALSLSIYKKAEPFYSTFDQLFKLAKAILADTGDTDAAGEIFAKISTAKPNAVQLISAATALADEINDKPAALGFLKQAELAVKSNDDFKKTAEAVLKYADDPEWIEAIKDQQQKREEHSALYNEFIGREGECATAINLCRWPRMWWQKPGTNIMPANCTQKRRPKGSYFPEFMALAGTISSNLQDSIG